MRVTKTNWRVKQREEMAQSTVAKRIRCDFVRGGKLVHAVPTLDEARKIADDIQALLDVANGDISSEEAERQHNRRWASAMNSAGR